MFRRIELEDLKDLEALNKFKSEYAEALAGVCWGCPGALESAVNKINYLNYIPMVKRLVKYQRKQIKDRYGRATVRHLHFTGKAISGIPGTVTPNNEDDQIVGLIKKHYPKVFNENYEDVVSEVKKGQNEAKAKK